MQEGLESDIRAFTFDLKAAYEKQGTDAANLRNSDAQEVLRHTYRDLVAWRTIIGQHCTVVAQALTGEPEATDPYGLGPTVARNPLHGIITCAVEDSRAVCVEKFGVAPEVEIVVHKDTYAVCLGARVHYCILELLKNSFRAMMDKYGSMEVSALRCFALGQGQIFSIMVRVKVRVKVKVRVRVIRARVGCRVRVKIRVSDTVADGVRVRLSGTLSVKCLSST